MKDLNEVELQLSRVGLHNRFWGRPEIRELPQILADDEVITNAANGRYDGGFALLVSTDRRLLLIDKKMWFMSLENVRYDMISEIDYSARLIDATVYIRTLNKVMQFTSLRQKSLRSLTAFVQEKIMELRMHEQHPYEQMIADQVSRQFQAQLDAAQATQPAAGLAITNDDGPRRLTTQPVRRLPMRPFKRIGAYPTASFTTQRRFSSRLY